MRIPLRTILDNASDATFMIKHVADFLNVQKNKASVDASGINGRITNIKSKIQTFISNMDDTFK